MAQTDDGTKIRMPLESNEVQLIVFGPGSGLPAVTSTNLDEVMSVETGDERIRVHGLSDSEGSRFASVCLNDCSIEVRGEARGARSVIPLDGQWEFELKPTMDKRYVEQQRGYYSGAAFPEPIRLECGPGEIATGDWSEIDGLLSYSGGAWYRKTVVLQEHQLAASEVYLDLANVVASAEVHVNGRLAGVRVTPPWRFKVTEIVKPGENRFEVLIYNTLADHYTTIPTRYGGSRVSGLLGPVVIEIRPRVVLSQG